MAGLEDSSSDDEGPGTASDLVSRKPEKTDFPDLNAWYANRVAAGGRALLQKQQNQNG